MSSRRYQAAAEIPAIKLAVLGHALGPVRPGELVVVAGRPSVGKTSLAIELAYGAAAVDRLPTLFFSLQAAMSDVVRRMLIRRAGPSADLRRLGHFGGKELDAFMKAAGDLADAPLLVSDGPALTLPDLSRILRRRRPGAPRVRLAIIDSVQLLDLGHRGEAATASARRVGRALKRLAMESGVILVVISSLDRAAGRRRVPRASDLDTWSPLGDAADALVLLHQANAAKRGANARPRVLIAKRRAS